MFDNIKQSEEVVANGAERHPGKRSAGRPRSSARRFVDQLSAVSFSHRLESGSSLERLKGSGRRGAASFPEAGGTPAPRRRGWGSRAFRRLRIREQSGGRIQGVSDEAEQALVSAPVGSRDLDGEGTGAMMVEEVGERVAKEALTLGARCLGMWARPSHLRTTLAVPGLDEGVVVGPPGSGFGELADPRVDFYTAVWLSGGAGLR